MKKSLLNPAKIGLILASFMLVCGIASGATYTAVASGNWSSSATWGGSAPPFTLTSADQVVIGAGINVTMDQSVTLNNALAEVTVTGTLSAAAYVNLTVISGSIAGSGSVMAARLMLNPLGTFLFTGSITADTLIDSLASLSLGAQIMVNDELALNTLVDIAAGGSLTMGTNSNITVSGGGIAVTGGMVNLSAGYSVNYTSASATAGLELSGSGLGNVTINVGNSNNVTLSTDLVANDSLKFVSGTLMLNGYNLTLNGQVSGSIMIAGNAASNLTINTTGGLADSILFPTGFQSLDNLTINVGPGNSVRVSSNLTVNGDLVISGSSILNINGINFTVAGNMTGTGSLMVNNNTGLILTGSSSVTGNINIIGSLLGNFTLNIGSGNMAMLGTNLAVSTLNLISGTLALNGNNLSVNTDISAGGTGVILSTPSSNISVTAAGSVSGLLIFSASGDTINNLTLNVGGGGSLRLGSNVILNGNLDFVNGYIDLNSNNLGIGVAGSVSGANSNAYVITNDGGYLTMYASISNTTIFQVGTSDSYLPAEISLNTGSSTGTIGVNASDGVYALGTSGTIISATQPMVNATWLFENNIGTGINANMQLSWMASAEVNGFIHTGDYISHYTSGWDDIIADTMTAIVSGSLYSVTRANITSMSPFAVFDQQTVTGIKETTESTGGDIQIYPNPAYDNLYIKNTSNSPGLMYVEIYNTLGQMVSSFQFKDAVFAVPVYGLTNGNYIIKFYNDNMQVVKKFSKL